MHYVYSDNSQPVPDSIKVFELPEGGWVTVEDGKRRTVTALQDGAEGFPLAPPQDPTKHTVVDLTPDLKDQLTRIENMLSKLS